MATDYVAIAREFGGVPATELPPAAPTDYEAIAREFGGVAMPAQPGQGEFVIQAPPVEVTPTTAGGLTGAVLRGGGPIAAGAAMGAAMGAPIGGVGAIPGAVAGAGAAGLAMAVGDPIVGAVNSLLGTKYKMPTDAMEDLFTRLGVPQARTEAERLVQTTTAAGAGAGGLAAAGQSIAQAAGAARPVLQGIGQTLATQPGAQIAGGMAGGGLGFAAQQAAQERGATPLGQLAASMIGNLLGGVAGGSAAMRAAGGVAPLAPSQLPSDLAAARRAGVRVMTSDVVPPRTFAGKWLQSVGERIPFAGTGAARKAQNVERIEAVRDLLLEFGADGATGFVDDVMRDLAAKRSAELTKYTQQKTDVIAKLSSNGLPVPVPNTIRAIDMQIAKLETLNSKQMEPIAERLRDWKHSIQGLNNQGQNLTNIEILRKQLGESFKAPELAGVRSEGEKILSSIYGPLKQDMTEFISANGLRNDVTKWKVANARLAGMMGELENNTLKSVLRRGDVKPEAVEQLLFSSAPSDVRALYANLTPQGRAKAQAAILSRAAKNASVEVAEGAVVSPEKFVNQIDKLGTSIGVMFTGDDKLRLDGLRRVLAITKRASEAAAMPVTGVQVAIPVGATALGTYFGPGVEGFIGALTAGAGLGLSARFYESAPVRNLLVRLGKTKPGSAAEAGVIAALTQTINRMPEMQQTQTKEQE